MKTDVVFGQNHWFLRIQQVVWLVGWCGLLLPGDSTLSQSFITADGGFVKLQIRQLCLKCLSMFL